MREKIISKVAAGVLLVALITCSFALCYTNKSYINYIHKTNDIVSVISEEEFLSDNVDNDGSINVNFNNNINKTKYITIKLKEDALYDKIIDVYLYGKANQEELITIVNAITNSKSGYAFLEIQNIDDVNSFMISEISVNTVDSIEFHENDFEYNVESIKFKYIPFLILVLLSLGVSVIFIYYDKKRNMISRIIVYIKKHKRMLILSIGYIVISLAVSILIENVVYRVMNIINIDTTFRYSRMIFVLCMFIMVGWIYITRNITQKFEIILSGYILIIGLSICCICPFGHAGWDIDTHYRLSLNASYLGDTYQTKTDLYITNARLQSLIKNDYSGNRENINNLNHNYTNIVDKSKESISLAHVPAGIGMALGRLFNLSFRAIYILGEVCNLLVYTVLCYLAMKKLKSGKLILASIALLPTNIFIACCYNYDYWVLGFSFLGIAYFIGEYQRQETKISYRDEIIMCFSLMVACIPKQIYLPMLVLPFFMPWKKMVSRVKYYIIAISPFILTGIMLIIRMFNEINITGDVRGGAGVNPVEQLYFIFNNAIAYSMILIKTIFSFLSFDFLKQGITNYGNLGFSTYGWSLIIIVIIIVTILDKSECDKAISNVLVRLYTLVLLLGGVALISTAFYLAYTAVGSESINGVQARYFTPIIYPFLAVVGFSKIKIEFDKRKLLYLLLVVYFVVNMFGVYNMMLVRLI
ncbi:DUF2142 domain-containing protein [Lachnospira sp.]|uniref:DUF2142 domain-containing protein n=1 Tax=Lachnospira sp. TaxID=2049031 RepID=UPI00257D8BBC|nr:DUF2142 domain-containing protein [Lachnospira sp.]